jgi:hypothetical protein
VGWACLIDARPMSLMKTLIEAQVALTHLQDLMHVRFEQKSRHCRLDKSGYIRV